MAGNPKVLVLFHELSRPFAQYVALHESAVNSKGVHVDERERGCLPKWSVGSLPRMGGGDQ